MQFRSLAQSRRQSAQAAGLAIGCPSRSAMTEVENLIVRQNHAINRVCNSETTDANNAYFVIACKKCK
jgi:hypothetical protein